VSFFAYPGQASSLMPGDGQVHQLAGPGDDVPAALAALAALAAPEARAVPQPAQRPALPGSAGGGAPEEALTAENAAAVIGALLPEGAIVSDEANTSGLWLPAATAGAPAHDWLTLTGGAIGHGLPVATGAAAACPDRPVLALEADGSAMYTISALWTHAREGLDVTTVIFSNRAYAILSLELQRVGATGPRAGREAGNGAGPAARNLLELSRPDIDFTALAAGMGVPASRASTTGEFAGQLRRALAEPGPHLIEAVVPPVG
jgi:acetolactate synthase I/II/III large subunit